MTGSNLRPDFSGGRAESDRFHIDPDVAGAVISACTSLLAEFEEIKRDVLVLQDVKGMGTLNSAQALARKFSLKAVGGEDSLEKSLDSHIDVVTEMRDYFQKCVDRYASIDAANAAAYVATEIPR